MTIKNIPYLSKYSNTFMLKNKKIFTIEEEKIINELRDIKIQDNVEFLNKLEAFYESIESTINIYISNELLNKVDEFNKILPNDSLLRVNISNDIFKYRSMFGETHTVKEVFKIINKICRLNDGFTRILPLVEKTHKKQLTNNTMEYLEKYTITESNYILSTEEKDKYTQIKGLLNINESMLWQLFNNIYNIFKQINIIESSQESEVFDRTVKAILLFCNSNDKKIAFDLTKQIIDNLISFIKKYAYNLPNPIHDIFQYKFSLNINNIAEWRMAIQQCLGIDGIKALTDIEIINQMIKTDIENSNTKLSVKEKNLIEDEIKKTIQKLNVKNLNELLMRISYNEYANNKELAIISKKYNVSKKQYSRMMSFERILNFKKYDNLPNITIYDSKSKLLWLKLPANEKIGYILGNIVNCCQHIYGNSEECVIDGMTRENNGFYILVKLNKSLKSILDITWDKVKNNSTIIGQSYAWKSLCGNLCLDSLEIHPTYSQSLKMPIREIIKNFTIQVCKGGIIKGVSIGTGGGTNAIFDLMTKGDVAYNILENPLRMLEGSMYEDADEQFSLDDKFQPIVSTPDDSLEQNIQMLVALKLTSEEKISKMLTDDDRCLYINALMGYVKIKSYISLEQFETIKDNLQLDIIISDNAIKAYQYGIIKFTDLKEMSNNSALLRTLTSEGALITCLFGGVKFSELKDVADNNATVFSQLTSDNAIKAYEYGIVKFTDLKEVLNNNNELFNKLISDNAFVTCQVGGATFFELRDIANSNEGVFSKLISDNAINAYKSGVKFVELRDLVDNETLFNKFISNDIIKLYKSGLKFAELKNIVDNLISSNLTSNNAFIACVFGEAKFSELKDIADNNDILFKKLTSDNIINAYKYGVKFSELKDIADNSDILFKKFTSDNVINAYECGVKFSELKDIADNDELFDMLTSDKAINAYRCKIPFVALKGIAKQGKFAFDSNFVLNTISPFFSICKS